MLKVAPCWVIYYLPRLYDDDDKHMPQSFCGRQSPGQRLLRTHNDFHNGTTKSLHVTQPQENLYLFIPFKSTSSFRWPTVLARKIIKLPQQANQRHVRKLILLLLMQIKSRIESSREEVRLRQQSLSLSPNPVPIMSTVHHPKLNSILPPQMKT